MDDVYPHEVTAGRGGATRMTRALLQLSVAALVWLLGAHHTAVTAQPETSVEPDRIERPADTTPATIQGAPAPPAPFGNLTLEAVNFRSDRGVALVALFQRGSGFPKRIGTAFWKRSLPIERGRLKFMVSNIPAGMIAAVVVHDENRNAKMDTGRFGQISEGYGTSRDARTRLGTPDFFDAAISLKPAESKYLRIAIHY